MGSPFARFVVATALAAICSPAAVVSATVELLRIEGVRNFPEATVPGAIQYACAADKAALPSYFSERGLPFDAKLVRGRQGRKACHIFYEPTIPGFRAAPDNARITALFGSVDPAGFVAGRAPIGDSLDILKAVLPRLGRPVDLTVSVTRDHDPALWPAALERHFTTLADSVRLVESEADSTHPWAQDYVKSGSVDGELRILVPHRLFEGRRGDGAAYRPLLDAFDGPEFVRSKLSWEGGDIQFAADPRDPSRLILFHSGAALEYWGAGLSQDEYSYVLSVEFGADHAVNFVEVGPHTDYLVAFLPLDGIALVSRPVRDDLDLATEALAAIVRLLGDRTPAHVRLLQAALRKAIAPDPQEIAAMHEQIELARSDLLALPQRLEPALEDRFGRYLNEHCPTSEALCLSGEGRREFLRRDPDLLAAALDAAARFDTERQLPMRLLGIVERQLPLEQDFVHSKLDAKAREIAKLGFKVVRTPILFPAATRDWPGVSYINMLTFERRLFVPTIGLGAVEDRLLDKMRKDLGGRYEIIPVPARSSLLMNGGVHCVFGIVREAVAR